MKKYEFTNEIIVVEGHILHRIRALVNFLDVKAGDLGGWIEGEINLPQSNECWVYNDAKVYGKAKVSGKAGIYDEAIVKDNAKVYGIAVVQNHAVITDEAEISGSAIIEDFAEIHDKVKVVDSALVGGDICLTGKRKVSGYSILYSE